MKATIDAVKQQFPRRKLVAVLELHTYSSLNEKFMNEYNGAMDNADEAIVFYSTCIGIETDAELSKESRKTGI